MNAIRLTKRLIAECTHAGRCDDDVNFWVRQPRIANQLAKIPDDHIVRFLRSYGYEPDELQDADANRAKALWILAGNAKDEGSCTVWMDA